MCGYEVRTHTRGWLNYKKKKITKINRETNIATCSRPSSNKKENIAILFFYKKKKTIDILFPRIFIRSVGKEKIIRSELIIRLNA